MAMTEAPHLLELHRESVLKEWTDYNGHMNVAFYLLAFDHATDAFFDYVDLGRAYRERSNCSLFTLEAHVSYARELKEGDALRFTTQLIGYDDKRLHYFHRMYHAEEGYLAASNELLSIHVDLGTRRAGALPPHAERRLAQLMAAHRLLPRPPELGRAIGVKRKA